MKKYFRAKYICIALISLYAIACDDSGGVEGTPSLSIVSGSVPIGPLTAGGGSVFIDIDWAFTRWNISASDVTEGNAFIEAIAPTYAGAPDQGATTTKVKITFSSNSAPVQNSQQVTVTSLTGNLSQTITLTQAPKVIVPLDVTITPGTTFQTIAGFGGANLISWQANPLSLGEMQSIFGMEEGELGLSLLRVRIPPDPAAWAALAVTLQEAEKYDVKIIASPWSPPTALKSNSEIEGGYLLETNYAAYATHLNDFVQFMAGEGVTIDVVSIQNEPDITVPYESCDWSAAQMAAFLKDHAASITGTKIAAAESFNFNQTFTNTLLNDANVVDKFDIVAGHIYGSGLTPYPLAQEKGKEIWMTEYLMNQNSGSNASNWNQSEAVIWDETLQMLTTIHNSMSYNWNAYLWWYIKRYYSFMGDGIQGTTSGTLLKRGYAMSHFAKFVRPGYERINIQAGAATELDITAYSGDDKVVIVLINSTANPVYSVNFIVPIALSSAMAYTTSVTQNQEMQNLTPNGTAVTLDVGAKSVITIVLE